MDLQLVAHLADATDLPDGMNQLVHFIGQHLPSEGDAVTGNYHGDSPWMTNNPTDR